MTQWAEETHQRIAASIKRYRGDMSAQQLSERTAELGYPLSRSQIANYESGRKKNLDIAELLVIAAALNVPPVVLIYPGPYGADVEFLPGRIESGIHAANWFSGIEAPESLVGIVVGERLPFHGDWKQWEGNAATLQLSRVLEELEQMRSDFLSDHDRRTLSDINVIKRLDSLEDQIRLVKKQIADGSRDA